ncbi:hypothetical protein [Pseudomonas sp. MWU13-2105]|uniref:hypothetical protein n=1 Tax=Pseudomonas sp. MWU13-2105 TaxID=2935074 RepID=UPI00200C7BE5|nr:hypothetical protein [Pseudomonas sp. MWU13-2105]
MNKLIERVDDNGVRRISIAQGSAAAYGYRTLNGFDSGLDLMLQKIASGLDFETFSERLAFDAQLSPLCPNTRPVIPLKPSEPRDCCVSGFGYTHTHVNAVKAPTREAPDWYYKGNGNSLVVAQEIVTTPFHACSAGFEVEYICVYVIDHLRNPRYCGYTLAFDFSDPDLRHRHPSLAGLSKLRQTVVCPELVLGDLPQQTTVSSSVIRKGEVAWKKSSQLGSAQLNISKPELETMLFQHDTLCEPGTVHFVLLGAAISSDRDGFQLKDGDLITACSDLDSLEISVSYEDEAVRCSCN